MRHKVFASAMILFLSSALPSVAQDQKACPLKTAPSEFPMVSDSTPGRRNPGNEGIQPGGFVNLSDGTLVVHGIDVSKYQDDASFTSVQKCGAVFGYVRLTSGTEDMNTHEDINELLYRTHWSNVRAAGLLPGPYHHLSILPKDIKPFQADPPETIREKAAALKDRAIADAKTQAGHFIDRLNELKSLDPVGVDGTKSKYLPPALDLSERPGAGGSLDQRAAFSELYGAMVCTFVSAIKQYDAAGPHVILFINPEDYVTYHLDAAPCDLSGALIWVRSRPMDGDLFTKSLPPDVVQSLCASDKSNALPHSIGRCIMEQYSSFGGFAVFDVGKPLDLDRFFGTREELEGLAQNE